MLTSRLHPGLKMQRKLDAMMEDLGGEAAGAIGSFSDREGCGRGLEK